MDPRNISKALHYLKLQVRVAERQYREIQASNSAPALALMLASERLRLAREDLDSVGWFYANGADHAGTH